MAEELERNVVGPASDAVRRAAIARRLAEREPLGSRDSAMPNSSVMPPAGLKFEKGTIPRVEKALQDAGASTSQDQLMMRQKIARLV